MKVKTQTTLRNIWGNNASAGFTDGKAKFMAKPTTTFKQPSVTLSGYGGFYWSGLGALFTSSQTALNAAWSWVMTNNSGGTASDPVTDVPFWVYTEIDGEKYLKTLSKYKTNNDNKTVRCDITGSNAGGSRVLWKCFLEWTYVPDMKCFESAIRYSDYYISGGYTTDYVQGPLYAKYIPEQTGDIVTLGNGFFVGGVSDTSDKKYPIISDSGELTMTGFGTPYNYSSNPKTYIWSSSTSTGGYTAIRVGNNDDVMRSYVHSSQWTSADYFNLSIFKNDLLRKIGYTSMHLFTGAPLFSGAGKGIISFDLKSSNDAVVMFRSDPFPQTGAQQSNISVYTDEAMTTPLSSVSIPAGGVQTIWIKNDSDDLDLWIKPGGATYLNVEGDITLTIDN